ncbi:MAG: L-threonylcarbamoyladenylate synthase [Ferruginibacter sp.]
MISNNISAAATVLCEGGLVAIPTETVYGLAANIYNAEAVDRIFSLKKRPLFNPLIVHIGRQEDLKNLVENVPPLAAKLADQFWPGPLTLLLPKKDTIPDRITAGKPMVAIRMPHHAMTLELLRSIPFPLAAPSANPFGRISPTRAEHVDAYFGNELPVILDGGPCQTGIESTIIGVDNNRIIIYRAGTITEDALRAFSDDVVTHEKKDSEPVAPGMLDQHYAPQTNAVLTNNVIKLVQEYAGKRIGCLMFQTLPPVAVGVVGKVLSSTGKTEEAAAHLYAYLHELDAMALDILILERLPETGVGKAINDRLQRAASGHLPR